MLEQIDVIMNKVLEPITVILAYPTVYIEHERQTTLNHAFLLHETEIQ
jgi:hypothetical protein